MIFSGLPSALPGRAFLFALTAPSIFFNSSNDSATSASFGSRSRMGVGHSSSYLPSAAAVTGQVTVRRSLSHGSRDVILRRGQHLDQKARVGSIRHPGSSGSWSQAPGTAALRLRGPRRGRTRLGPGRARRRPARHRTRHPEDRVIDIAFDVNLEFGLYISPRVVTRGILNDPVWRETPFLKNVARDSIPL